MPIDPNIAMGFRQPQIESPLNQFALMSQIENAQSQNALAQYQIEAANRNALAENALNEAYSNVGTSDDTAIIKYLAKSGAGSKIPEFQKKVQEAIKLKSENIKLSNENVTERLKQSREETASITTPEQYFMWVESNFNDPVLSEFFKMRGITKDKAVNDAVLAMQQPGGFEKLLTASRVGVEKAIENQYIEQNLGPNTRILALPKHGGGGASVVQGSTARIGMSDYQRAQLANEQTRIGLERERTQTERDIKLRTLDPEYQRKMSEAKAIGEAIGKDKVLAQKALPKIIDDTEMMLENIDKMIGKQEIRDKKGKVLQEETAPHPGFKGAVGFGYGARFIPGTSESDFQALYDQVMGGVSADAYLNTLKGTGNVTEEEGKRATAAITSMKLAQGEEEFIKAANVYRKTVRKGLERAKRRVDIGQPSSQQPVTFLGFE